MQLEVYTAILARVTAYQSSFGIKTVGLWNNQFDREKENVSFGFPAVFFEFTNIVYEDYTTGVQRYEMDVNVHIGFESYKTTDTDILTLKQNINSILHTYSSATSQYETRLLRRSESQNFDHDNIQDYITTYRVTGKDYVVTNLPTTEATVTTLNTINAPQLSNKIIRTNAPI